METALLTAPAAPTGQDKIWAVFSHLSALFGVGLLLPLGVYLAMRRDSAYVATNAKEALNFHLSVLLYGLCCIPLMFVVVGIPLLFAIALGSVILAIIAAVRSSEGECYHYPLTIRFLS